jgi:transcriptional regulator with XRE-family HTH domain
MTGDLPDDPHVGARIAALRIRRGLTQRALAARAHVSYSLLTKVEAGLKPASPALIAACARALATEEHLLAGHHRPGVDHDRLFALMPPIRAALDLFDLPPDDAVQPRPLSELATAVRRVNRWAQAARYEPMALALPGLLAELHTAAHTFTGRDQETAWGLLAEASRCGHSVGIAIGLNDLSVTALQRMDWAATRTGDAGPSLRAAREYLRVTAYLRARDYSACWRLNASGLAHLEGADDTTPGVLVARGQLHLGASIIAAQTGDHDTMREHLSEAGRIAARVGELQHERFWFGFGPTNVAVHQTMALVAAGEHARAVTAAAGLRFPVGWLPTRIGHHHLDLARAYRWMNKPDQALDALIAARQAAPGQAQRHPLARDTITALLRSTRRRSTVLAEYAAWVGV